MTVTAFRNVKRSATPNALFLIDCCGVADTAAGVISDTGLIQIQYAQMPRHTSLSYLKKLLGGLAEAALLCYGDFVVGQAMGVADLSHRQRRTKESGRSRVPHQMASASSAPKTAGRQSSLKRGRLHRFQ
jgi:hypothetical protein